MDEIERKKATLQKYEEAKTKLESLDPETKALVLEAIRRVEFELRDEIATIERNMSFAYEPETPKTM